MNGRTMPMLLITPLLVTLAVPGPARAETPAHPRPGNLAAAGSVQPPAPAPRPAPAPSPAPRTAQPAPAAVQVLVDRTVRDVQLGPDGELDLGNIAGDIVITGGKGPHVRVEIVKAAHGSSLGKDEARELLDLVQVDVVERGNRVEVRTRYPQRGRGPGPRRNIGVTVAYQVTAPAGTRVRAQSVSGSITATGIRGESSYESVSGAIRVAQGGRVASAKSISGPVEISDTEMDTTLQASSASGSITLRRVKARRADLSSISGAILLAEVVVERIDAQTVSGRLQLDGALVRDGRYLLRSHSGSVQVTLANTTGFELDATTFSGAVRTDLPITTRAGDNGPNRNRVLRGVHGDGGPVLELTTFSGTISIARK
jgi:hypothetical protein